jgi:hypothetical protein
MLGVKRAVNPHLKLAGDGVGKSDIRVLETMAAQFSDTKFLVTMLSRENQHELCVVARKFRNVHIFGCWWFTNIPHIIDEMTRMRLELLGLSVTPQHSDARVLDQIIYKWDHSKQVIGRVLVDKYCDLAATGWQPTREEIERDVRDLFGGAFETFLKARFKTVKNKGRSEFSLRPLLLPVTGSYRRASRHVPGWRKSYRSGAVMLVEPCMLTNSVLPSG